jgi:hypothetical protein
MPEEDLDATQEWEFDLSVYDEDEDEVPVPDLTAKGEAATLPDAS